MTMLTGTVGNDIYALLITSDLLPLTGTLKKIGDGSVTSPFNGSALYLGVDKVGFNEAVHMAATSTQLNQLTDNTFDSQINVPSYLVSGTNGNGHGHYRWQATDATSNANHTVLFADATGNMAIIIDGGTKKILATTSDLSGYQPLDSDLTSIAGIVASNDDFIQRKSGVWTNRTINQVKSDLGLSGTNTGDQDLSPYQTIANKSIDGTLASNSDTLYPSQKAVKTYVDALIAASDAVVYKGVIDCSTNPNYPAADAGHLYIVSVAGKIGGASGVNVEAKDFLICKVDGSASGTEAGVGANWNVVQGNVDGAVTGPASSTDGNLALYNGSTGKIIKDSGLSVSTDGTFASNSDSLIPTQKAAKTYADAKVDDTAYNSTTWDGVTGTAPSKNAVRDKFVSVDSSISGKQDTLVSGTNIKSINGSSILGSGDLTVAATSLEVKTATIGTTNPASSTQDNYAVSGMSTSKSIHTIFIVTPSYSFKFTGFSSTSVEDGKLLTIINDSDPVGSDARIIILERGHGSSTSSAANRMFLPYSNGMPVIITPGNAVTLKYSTTNSLWEFVHSSESINPSGFFDIYSDCMVQAPFTATTATAGTVATQTGSDLSANATQKTIGTLLHTISTNGGAAYLGTLGSSMFLGAGAALGMVRCHPVALADVTDDYILEAGFTDGMNLTYVDRACWVYDRSTSTDWRTQCTSNTTNASGNTVTGFTPSTTVYSFLGVFVNGTGTNVDFFYSVDSRTWSWGTSETNATNIPSGTSRTLGFAVGVKKTAGSGSKTMATDWLGLKIMMERGV